MLNSAEHEIFSANKYENTKNSWHFHILAGKFSCSAMFSKKNVAVIGDLLAGQILCSAELSMKKSFITSRPGASLSAYVIINNVE